MGFPGESNGKESACDCREDLGLIPELGRSPEEAKATHRTEEPGRLQSIGSQSVGHDWVTEHSTTNACENFARCFYLFSMLYMNYFHAFLIVYGKTCTFSSQ